jgi:integrase
MREPWWREQTGHWYVTVHGKQHRLTEEPDPDGGRRKKPPKHVEDAWHDLVKKGRPKDMTVRSVIDRFKESRQRSEGNGTNWCLRQFERHVGPDCKASSLRPFHLTELFRKNPQWGESTKRTITTRVLAALNYAVREGLLDTNPISSTPGFRPHGSYERRSGVIDPALRQRLEDAARPAMRDFLVGLRETGCRPSELRRARIERCFLDQGVLFVPNKTAQKTGKPERTIYLTAEMTRLVRRLVAGRSQGFIFLTATKRPWTYNNLEQHWSALAHKVQAPKGITLYTYRRTYISTAINEKNVNPALVAQLVGHVGLDVLLKHYLQEDPEALKRAVSEITRNGPAPGSTP